MPHVVFVLTGALSIPLLQMGLVWLLLHYGDIDPDYVNSNDGVQQLFYKKSIQIQTK
jgi:hypothetical protein